MAKKKKSKAEKVVLAYSGGLDTSVILPWLKETYGYDVIAFAAELGQGDELEGIKKKAMASGATKCVVKDLRKEFVEDYLWPMLKAGAVYEKKYLLGTSVARPLIAKHQVDVAHADEPAHENKTDRKRHHDLDTNGPRHENHVRHYGAPQVTEPEY